MDQIEEKFSAIKRLEKSEVFSEHKLIIKILNYLVVAERDNIALKSTTIALEVLGDEKEFYSSQDAFIRAQIYRLRKKLELYYLTEGKHEKTKIVIPKGRYKVKLITTEELKKKGELPLMIKGLLILMPLLLCVSLYFNFFENGLRQKAAPIPVLLEKSISNNNPTQIVIGERFFYRELDPALKRFRLILDPNRNLNRYNHKMTDFIRTHAERKVSVSKLTYINPSYSLQAMDYKNSLLANNRACSILLASELKEINQNIVFFGDIGIGDAWLLSSFIDKSNISFSIEQFSGAVSTKIKESDDSTLSFDWQRSTKKARKSYYIILKEQSVNHHDVLLLLSGGAMARDYMEKKIIDIGFIDEIQNVFSGRLPSKYELLVEIEGQENLGFKHKIVYSKNLEESK